MFTRMLRMIVRKIECKNGHCSGDGGGPPGHCS